MSSQNKNSTIPAVTLPNKINVSARLLNCPTNKSEPLERFQQETQTCVKKPLERFQQETQTCVKKAPRKKPDLRLTPGRHIQLAVPLEDLINTLLKENKVVAFVKGSRSAPLCGFSQKVVAILESQGVDYETVDVLDEEYNYGLRETGIHSGRSLSTANWLVAAIY